MDINVRSEYKQLSNEMLQTLQKSLSNEISILLFNVRTSGNVAMIIRHACLLGFKEVIVCGRKHYDKRFTVGANHYIPVHYVDSPLKVKINTVSPGVYTEELDYNVDDFINVCGYRTPVFLEQGGTDIRNINWKSLNDNIILIVGNESLGIPKDFVEGVKKRIPQTITVSIPQWSVMRSMNCAMAVGTIMWEIRRSS